MIRIGSRGSQLALWQARHIESKLRELGAETSIEIIKTSGDKITDVPLAQIGGKGLFTKEIEEALLAGTIDLAVHSLKDVPTVIPDGLTLAAFPEREDPRDALVGKKLNDLRPGDRIGTSSLRRTAQLGGHGFIIETLRGNVDTRLKRLDEGRFDSIVLAAAGLRRLGWAGRITELLDPEIMCPAVGQGALAIETRNDGGSAWELARKLDHESTRVAVTAERSLLATLEGGCQVPIGAHAVLDGSIIRLRAIVASPDGSQMILNEACGSDPAALGRELGEKMLRMGAREILRG